MRVVSDRFGELKIADNLFYGVQTARTLENMSFSRFKMSEYPSFIKALALVKEAAACANYASGNLEESTCSAIKYACSEIKSGRHNSQFPVDMLHGGGSIGFNQNMNEVIATLAAQYLKEQVQTKRSTESPSEQVELLPKETVDAKAHVNLSQSTADACSTAFRLCLAAEISPLLSALEEILAGLAHLEKEFGELETVARTCLQDAMPVKFAGLFSGWYGGLERSRLRIIEQQKSLSAVNLGGTVIGSGEGASPAYRNLIVPALSKLLGRELSLKVNLYDAAQNIDEITALSGALELLAQILIKICQDLRLLSSGPQNGFAELILPALQDGSSFFSEKNNPVVPETVMQACFHVLGNHRAAMAALEHAELNLNIFESGAFFHTLDSLEILSAAISLLRSKAILSLKVNTKRCSEMLEKHKQSLQPKEETGK